MENKEMRELLNIVKLVKLKGLDKKDIVIFDTAYAGTPRMFIDIGCDIIENSSKFNYEINGNKQYFGYTSIYGKKTGIKDDSGDNIYITRSGILFSYSYVEDITEDNHYIDNVIVSNNGVWYDMNQMYICLVRMNKHKKKKVRSIRSKKRDKKVLGGVL